jgi:serine/threonine protein kinase
MNNGPRQFELKVDQLADTDGFGKHRIKQAIGSGGMGIVYRTIRELGDERIGKTYAAKTVRSELHDRKDIFAKFNRESQVIIPLDHENILSTHGLFWTINTPQRIPLIFMDFLKGRTLREVMDTVEDQFPTWAICFVAQGVLAALHYIHEQGIIHRDIKPENIFIHTRGKSQRIKLMDFGIVRELRTARDSNEHRNFLGSDGFSPPEQIVGDEEVTARSDLYALSCVLYEMFALRPVFPGLVTPQDIRKAHCFQAPTPLHLLAPNAPRDLVEMVMRGLHKDPGHRPVSALVYAEPFNHAVLATARNASNTTLDNIVHTSFGDSLDARSPKFVAPRAPVRLSSLPMHTVRMNLVQPQPAAALPWTTAPSAAPEGLPVSRPGTEPVPPEPPAALRPTVPPQAPAPLPSLESPVAPEFANRAAPAAAPAAVLGNPMHVEQAPAPEPRRPEAVVGPLSSIAWGDASSAMGGDPRGAPAVLERYVEESAPEETLEREDRRSVASVASVLVALDEHRQPPLEKRVGDARTSAPSAPQRRVTSTTDPSTRAVPPAERKAPDEPSDPPPEVPLAGPRPLYIGVTAAALIGLAIAFGIVTLAEPHLPQLFRAADTPPATASATAPPVLAPAPRVASSAPALPQAMSAPSAMPPPAAPAPPGVAAPVAPVASAAPSPTLPPRPKASTPRPRATAQTAAPASSIPDIDLFEVIRPDSPAPPKPKSPAPLPNSDLGAP